MPTKPTPIGWNPPNGVAQEPNAGKKTTGWLTETAPSQAFNWFWRQTSRWQSFLEARTDSFAGVASGVSANPVGTDFLADIRTPAASGTVLHPGAENAGTVFHRGGAFVVGIPDGDVDGDTIVCLNADGSKRWGDDPTFVDLSQAVITNRWIAVGIVDGAADTQVRLYVADSGDLEWTEDYTGIAYLAGVEFGAQPLGGRLYVAHGTTVEARDTVDGASLFTPITGLDEDVLAISASATDVWFGLVAPDSSGDSVFRRSSTLTTTIQEDYTLPGGHIPSAIYHARAGGVYVVASDGSGRQVRHMRFDGNDQIGPTFPLTNSALVSDGVLAWHVNTSTNIARAYSPAGVIESARGVASGIGAGQIPLSFDGMAAWRIVTSGGETRLQHTTLSPCARRFQRVPLTGSIATPLEVLPV